MSLKPSQWPMHILQTSEDLKILRSMMKRYGETSELGKLSCRIGCGEAPYVHEALSEAIVSLDAMNKCLKREAKALQEAKQ